MILLLWVAALPCVYWQQGVETAASLKAAGIERVCVPREETEAWRKAGLTASPLSAGELELRDTVAVPGIRARADRASATRSPWVNANGWRFLRDPSGEYAYELPAGKAALAAAEAYVYGVDAVLKIDPADLTSLGETIAFLSHRPTDALPELADFAVVDDGSAALGEVLNLLVRRNLLFRFVKEPSSGDRVTVKLGTSEYPLADAADPSAFALKIRGRITDEARTLRLFGTEVVIARLVGDGTRFRLHLLNYGGRDIEGLRVRLRGGPVDGTIHRPGSGPVALEERVHAGGATEFTVPRLGPYGVVDLAVVR